MKSVFVKFFLVMLFVAMSFAGCKCSDEVEDASEAVTGKKQIDSMNKMKKTISEIEKKKQDDMDKVLDKD